MNTVPIGLNTERNEYSVALSKITNYIQNELKRSPGVMIEKYAHIPESVIQEAFSQVEYNSRNSDIPKIIINVDETTLKLFDSDDQTNFYRSVAGSVIRSIGQSKFADTDNYKLLLDLYENNFSRIYATDETKKQNDKEHLEQYLKHNEFNLDDILKFEKESRPLMKTHYSFGDNLRLLLNSSNDEYNSLRTIVNISALDNYKPDVVEINSDINSSLISKEDAEIADLVILTNLIAYQLFQHQGLPFSDIALPGWALDVFNKGSSWHKNTSLKGACSYDFKGRYSFEL